jgi:hypothetical protein
MASLPVICKSIKNTSKTRDIFLSWFNEGFVPAIKNYLHSRKLVEKAALLLHNCSEHPPPESLKPKEVVVMFLPTNTTVLIRSLEEVIIQAFKTYYQQAVLTAVVNSELQVLQFLKTVTLKNIAYSIGLAWKNINSLTVKNCWLKCILQQAIVLDTKESF